MKGYGAAVLSGEFCIAVGPVSRTAGIMTDLDEGSGSLLCPRP